MVDRFREIGLFQRAGTSSPHLQKGAHMAIEKELLDRLLAEYDCENEYQA
jgi:hypothetical protein